MRSVVSPLSTTVLTGGLASTIAGCCSPGAPHWTLSDQRDSASALTLMSVPSLTLMKLTLPLNPPVGDSRDVGAVKPTGRFVHGAFDAFGLDKSCFAVTLAASALAGSIVPISRTSK